MSAAGFSYYQTGTFTEIEPPNQKYADWFKGDPMTQLMKDKLKAHAPDWIEFRDGRKQFAPELQFTLVLFLTKKRKEAA
jgi:hypothetical protein